VSALPLQTTFVIAIGFNRRRPRPGSVRRRYPRRHRPHRARVTHRLKWRAKMPGLRAIATMFRPTSSASRVHRVVRLNRCIRNRLDATVRVVVRPDIQQLGSDGLQVESGWQCR
jgi:hypothetical protein